MSRFLLVLAFALLYSTGAKAFFLDGNDFLSWCQRGPPMAMGYVVGVADNIVGNAEIFTDKAELVSTLKLVCLPKNVTTGQLRDVACEFIRKYPANRHRPASMVVEMSLTQAFPCQKK